MIKIGVLGSGKGSNFQSIIDAVKADALDAEVVCVLTDVKDAYILERAKKEGVPGEYVDCAPFKTKLDGEGAARMRERLAHYGADYIVLAGFMRILKHELLEAFAGRIVNIHPSLLPSFPGLWGWKQAIRYGVKVSGCTVHFIDEGMDTGPIIIQRAVPVYDDDTPETLHARIQEQEHIAYPEALRLIADGRLRIEGRKVSVAPA